MAFVSQQLKKELAPQIKAVLKQYGMKGTISVRNRMTLCVRVMEGKLPLIENFVENLENKERGDYVIKTRSIDVNTYHYQNQFTGKCKQFLKDLHAAMNRGNHDRSDIMTDYFDVGWYVDINIGDWKKPYQLVK